MSKRQKVIALLSEAKAILEDYIEGDLVEYDEAYDHILEAIDWMNKAIEVEP